jgi:hypothetical protein
MSAADHKHIKFGWELHDFWRFIAEIWGAQVYGNPRENATVLTPLSPCLGNVAGE